MRRVDLPAIVEKHKLDTGELAELLFPVNKHKTLALNRVLKGESQLDADQLSRLAAFLNMPIDALYGSTWVVVPKSKKQRYENGEYIAEIDPASGITKIFHKKSLLFQEVIHAGATTIMDFFKQLDLIILNFKK